MLKTEIVLLFVFFGTNTQRTKKKKKNNNDDDDDDNNNNDNNDQQRPTTTNNDQQRQQRGGKTHNGVRHHTESTDCLFAWAQQQKHLHTFPTFGEHHFGRCYGAEGVEFLAKHFVGHIFV